MHRHARPVTRAVVALATAAVVLAPAVAWADDTPTGSPTTPAAPTTTAATTSPSVTATAAPTTSAPTSPAPTSSSPASTRMPTPPATKQPKAGASPTRGTQRFTASRLAADPAPNAQQAAYAAGFVSRTLAAGGNHYVYPGTTFADGGNTIDGILALDGAGVGLAEADAATDYLAAHVGDYIGAGGESYAGPTAKLLIGVLSQGGDPEDFGGVDLVTRLSDLEGDDGHFADDSAFGDASNTIGQSLAIIAVGRATGSVSDVAVDFLLGQQCDDGGFRGDVRADDCVSDPDATGFAVQALAGVLDPDDPALVAALDWLAGKQLASGGIGNSAGTANANTTGVAAQAFAAAGRDAELAKAQAFLLTLQYDCSFPAALRGGIAFTAAEKAARKASGAAAKPADSDLRATPQATLGLAGESLLTVTGEGAEDTAPALACTTPVGSVTGTPTAPAPPDSLALTGSEVTPLLVLALLLVLAGGGAVAVGRRVRGTHA